MKDNKVLLEIKDLHKSFGDLEVLKGISTDIKKGEVVAVIGPSGSGKSTFIRCLNLLEMPTSGEIIFEGEEITGKDVKASMHRERSGWYSSSSICLIT